MNLDLSSPSKCIDWDIHTAAKQIRLLFKKKITHVTGLFESVGRERVVWTLEPSSTYGHDDRCISSSSHYLVNLYAWTDIILAHPGLSRLELGLAWLCHLNYPENWYLPSFLFTLHLFPAGDDIHQYQL